MSAIKHFIRYGTAADTDILGAHLRSDSVDCVVFNANMAAHAPGAIAGFMASFMAQAEMGYLVDPLSHAFQYDAGRLFSPGKATVKGSWARLARQYGKVCSDVAENSTPLSLASLGNDEALEDLVRGVVGFQESLSSRSDDDPLLSWLEQNANVKESRPFGIVPPYFYLNRENRSGWIDVNIRSIRMAAKLFPGRRIFAQLLLSDLADGGFVSDVVGKYKDVAVSGYLIWIDNFDEHVAGEAELGTLVDLVRELSTVASVYNLYGSYFSVLVGKYVTSALDGVCHGLEYGEYRAAYPLGGGIPMAKFYHPKVHQRLRYEECLPLVRPYLDHKERYLKHVCSCPECRLALSRSNDPSGAFALYGESTPHTQYRNGQTLVLNYPTTETKRRCLNHYLHAKEAEYHLQKSASEAVSELTAYAEEIEASASPVVSAHLRRWARVLEEKI